MKRIINSLDTNTKYFKCSKSHTSESMACDAIKVDQEKTLSDQIISQKLQVEMTMVWSIKLG